MKLGSWQGYLVTLLVAIFSVSPAIAVVSGGVAASPGAEEGDWWVPDWAELQGILRRKSEEIHRPIKGIYVPPGFAGDAGRLDGLIQLVLDTELNALVIDVKDDNGWITYRSELDAVHRYRAQQVRLGDLTELTERLRGLGIYSIARLVVFKDSRLAAARPDLAVAHVDGGAWRDQTGAAWMDPYSREVWQYNIDVAVEVARAGFDEIQFDYVRYPTDGHMSAVRYTWLDEDLTRAEVITGFLEDAQWALAAEGAYSSADVFGLVTTVTDDMRIGQNWEMVLKAVDYISPMIYPSHYGPNIYRIPVPNEAPYDTVWHAMRDAVRRTTPRDAVIRPWLQDFSMGYRYGPAEVQAQIEAVREHGLDTWLLWNPRGVYTREVLSGAG